jgi:hypothetical protein
MLKGLNYLKAERYNYIINIFYKELAYLKLKQNMLFNEFKLSELYIKPIIDILQIIYKKKIIFNIVVLKNFYLNSSILLQIISAKARSRKIRGSSSRAIDSALTMITTPNLSGRSIPLLKKEYTGKQNIILSDLNFNVKKDYLNEFLQKNKTSCNN